MLDQVCLHRVDDPFRPVFTIAAKFLRNALHCDKCRCVVLFWIHLLIPNKEFLDTVSRWILDLDVGVKK